MLEGLGYRHAVDTDDRASQHYPSFFHPDEMARVELHRAILRPRDSALLPPMEAAAGIEWQEWEGTHIGRLDALSRALCSFYQCTRPEYRPITASEVPLMKAFDFVGRIHADFGGVLPPAFLERVAMAGWEPAARRFLTLTDVYFGLPNPLAPDLAYIRAVERRAGRPRWHLTLRTMRTLLTARGWEMVRHPWRAPGQFATYVGRLWAPGGAPRF
ncbi:hypothetical protein [Ancylobacter sp.]|uniref:hypothetical protein n=1 Tax=Ancylobacter sp. TaxID=1872567 RepID=UPI003D0D7081